MFPIRDNIPSRRFPFMNYLIIAANTWIFINQLGMEEEELRQFFFTFGMVPAQFTDPAAEGFTGFTLVGLFPFVTNMFLHGGWLHYLSNMWTLYIFGDNVEDRMGPFRYLFFYLLTGLAASVTHFFLYAYSPIPTLGASGAISGIMGAYLFLFPMAKITFLFPILFIPFFFNISAYIYIVIWFLTQLINGLSSYMFRYNSQGIAFWAHIGGFAAGVLAYYFFVNKRRKRKYV